jgi:hypothetical protein
LEEAAHNQALSTQRPPIFMARNGSTSAPASASGNKTSAEARIFRSEEELQALPGAFMPTTTSLLLCMKVKSPS